MLLQVRLRTATVLLLPVARTSFTVPHLPHFNRRQLIHKLLKASLPSSEAKSITTANLAPFR
jgi:hypothetical protein